MPGARFKQMSEDEMRAHRFESPLAETVIAEALNAFGSTCTLSMPLTATCPGAGVYALYYFGSFAPYQLLAIQTRIGGQIPIYVGKAVPVGWRTSRQASLASTTAGSVCARLGQHARTIYGASNLDITDFECRFMVVAASVVGMIPAIESALINKFHPLWNSVVDGFGNHDPGRGRYGQVPSEWDILHPGRSWLARLTNPSPVTEREIIQRVEAALKFLS